MTLTMKTKIITTVIAALVSASLSALLTPAAQLAANVTIVGQLASSDTASLANTLVGSGGMVHGSLWVAYVMVIAYVWTRKTTSTNKE